jgi:succinate dehydrogenase/fumarate reductase flavoprotein subunit
MAERAGGIIDKDSGNGAFWAPASLFKRRDGADDRFVHLLLDRAKPGFIAVGPNGRRFVNEAGSYHHFVEGMIRAGLQRAFLIGDSEAVGKYGIGRVLPGGWGMRRYLRDGYLLRADSIGELAAKLSVERAALNDTVDRYNRDAAGGIDSEYGKGRSAYDQYMGDPLHKPNPCVAPLRRGPFYAVTLVAGDIGTAVGLRVDGSARVLRADGAPIGGLYACGNDMSSINGGTYFGSGATLGPALVFGYIAAMHMMHQ